jgi:hypothetical protein
MASAVADTVHARSRPATAGPGHIVLHDMSWGIYKLLLEERAHLRA